MKLHDKSCMLDSLCFVLGIKHLDAILITGHDGSERGFHSQEIVDVATSIGYAITEVQRYPRAINPQTYERIDITFPEGNDTRFASYLAGSEGVVMGSKLGRPHAVAWKGRIATDPANSLNFRLLDDKDTLVEEFFKPITLLKVNRT